MGVTNFVFVYFWCYGTLDITLFCRRSLMTDFNMAVFFVLLDLSEDTKWFRVFVWRASLYSWEITSSTHRARHSLDHPALKHVNLTPMCEMAPAPSCFVVSCFKIVSLCRKGLVHVLPLSEILFSRFVLSDLFERVSLKCG
ncbi:hypothetical protein XELAEV_18007348mg [Xenopus laevis]|uniref:Uncharacterized protein n=1 Tax=Xenopus laevis TaxID=8355 RepID=A0A974E2W6_XENLA|nr:hypothetical protein XELAEV_18007348mg [Xenopus laevis]